MTTTDDTTRGGCPTCQTPRADHPWPPQVLLAIALVVSSERHATARFGAKPVKISTKTREL